MSKFFEIMGCKTKMDNVMCALFFIGCAMIIVGYIGQFVMLIMALLNLI